MRSERVIFAHVAKLIHSGHTSVYEHNILDLNQLTHIKYVTTLWITISTAIPAAESFPLRNVSYYRLRRNKRKCVIRPLICRSQFTREALGSTHVEGKTKSKTNTLLATGEHDFFFFAILNGGSIATKGPDSPVHGVGTSILISSVPALLLPPVCAAPSWPILKTKRGTSNFLVIKFNMRAVICDFLRKIKARCVHISRASFCIQRRNYTR